MLLIVGDLSSKALLTTRTFATTSLLVPSLSLSLSSSQPFRRTHLAARLNGSPRVSASKNPPKLEISQLLEMQGLRSFDAELGGDFDDEDDGDEEDDDDDEGFILPLEKMKEWIENKPRGFGEGKVYDTGVEDQLLDEMRQSREAQAANLNKLKNDPLGLIQSKREEQSKKKKADEVVPNGVRVRVSSLPKKKNVHRDLSSAFKGVTGLVSINPAVSGNSKTRDPICKGYGFVYFKSEKDANRFIETFSRQNITFGKVQKQIKCEIVDSLKSDSIVEKSTGKISQLSEIVEVQVSAVDEGSDSSLEEWENSVLAEFEDSDDEFDGDELYESEWEDFDEEEEEEEEEENESVTELELNESGSYQQRTETVREQQQPVKKLTVKDKDAKVPKIKTPSKLDIPGSAKRLKVKEKAVLNDVFNKYGKKSAVGSKKGRKKS